MQFSWHATAPHASERSSWKQSSGRRWRPQARPGQLFALSTDLLHLQQLQPDPAGDQDLREISTEQREAQHARVREFRVPSHRDEHTMKTHKCHLDRAEDHQHGGDVMHCATGIVVHQVYSDPQQTRQSGKA